MNFDFSDDLKLLRDQAHKFLAQYCSRAAVRRVFEGSAPYEAGLWRSIAEMGWLGAAMPDAFGGAGLGYDGLCVLCEELGYALAPVPFASSIYLAGEAILAAGSNAQKQALLPALIAGTRIATLALAEGPGNPRPAHITTRVTNGRLSGIKFPVPDGEIADDAVVVATDETGETGFYWVDLSETGISRSPLASLDPSRPLARIRFDAARCERLAAGAGFAGLERLLDRAAILMAFEQLGGAQACLEMAKTYATERYAFGRPIGSFQAITHKLADVYVAIELARSNAYYGAWAIATNAAELTIAAAAARVSATQAYERAAAENIQTHGGMGFTWESDPHLHYRRAKLLSTMIGSAPYWKDRLISALEARNAA
jgi:acyl-CoA dehydrogenase